MMHHGIMTHHFFGRVVLLRMNAPNLALYNTHGVGDKGGNPLLKRFIIFYFLLYFFLIEE
jgi:hypothetical protein